MCKKVMLDGNFAELFEIKAIRIINLKLDVEEIKKELITRDKKNEFVFKLQVMENTVLLTLTFQVGSYLINWK